MNFKALFAILILISACTGTRPTDLGITDAQLKACPESPNCVSTQASDEDHRIEHFVWAEPLSEAKNALKEKISSQFANAELITETDNYLYYEFTSSLMRFVDDVELYFSEGGIIQIRSASRLGKSDFGVNRKRIEALRSPLAK